MKHDTHFTSRLTNGRVSDGDGLNVLILDRDPVSLSLLSQELRTQDYRVTLVSDWESVIAGIESRPPDVLLIGRLSQLARWEVCAYARGMAPPSQLVILVLFARPGSLSLARCLKDGADGCVEEPVTGPTVVEHIQRAKQASAQR